jgi:hypothetical protein
MRGTISFRVACTVEDHKTAGLFIDDVITAINQVAIERSINFDHGNARYFIEVEQDFGVQ